MKTRAAFFGLVLLVCVVAIAVGPAFAAESGCERAATIRKHVAETDKMPEEVKKALLMEADSLCPPKVDVSGEMKQAEKLVSQKKYTDALQHFQFALAGEDKATCKRVFEIARKLKAEGQTDPARRFFEAGLSLCYDKKTFEEYRALPVKTASADLEAKGEGDLVKKETIVESLVTRPEDRESERESIGVEPRQRYGRDYRYFRYARLGRDDDDRWDSRHRPRPFRPPCADDEDCPGLALAIQFESGSATLSHRSRRQLDELGMALDDRELRHVRRFFIDGHTDSIGDEETNCDLAFRRAEAVARYLEDHWNISTRRLIPRSYGKICPIAPNYDEDGRYLNRRVEIRNADMARHSSRYGRSRCH